MSGFFQNLLGSNFFKNVGQGFFGNPYLRDFTHSSKNFLPNAFQNTPHLRFLFHVHFDVNPQIYSLTGLSRDVNLSMYVKTARVPGMSIDYTKLNQYHRKRLVQTHINYDPVGVALHDDNGGTVLNFWRTYYEYYYADHAKNKFGNANLPSSNQGNSPQAQVRTPQTSNKAITYGQRTQYLPNVTDADKWGYYGETAGPSPSTSGVKPAFFNSIVIYSFHQHNFMAYRLVNPLITAMTQDTHSYYDSGNTMEINFTIDYEFLQYESGAIDGTKPSNIITSFGRETSYDRQLSPLGKPGTNASILGQGGLLDAAGGFAKNLAEGNLLGAIQTAGTSYNTFKNGNLKQAAKGDVKGIATAGILAATVVGASALRNVNFSTPTYAASPTEANKGGASTTGATRPPAVASTGGSVLTADGSGSV